MSKLRALLLRNFQRHKKRVLRFDKRVTVIVGSTDRGKSSIIRALRWVSLNAGPANIVRWGADKAVVSLKVGKSTVTRRKGGSNTYVLDGKKFKAFGTEVPPEIEGVLGMSDINFQRQHSAAFWFSETSGTISKRLNEIVNLGVIDSSLKKVATELRTLKTSVGISRDRLATAKDTRRELRFVKELEAELAELEKLWQDFCEAGNEHTALEEWVNKAREQKRAVGVEVPSLVEAEQAKEAFEASLENLNAMERLFAELGVATLQRDHLAEAHEELHGKFHAEFDGVECPTCEGKGHL